MIMKVYAATTIGGFLKNLEEEAANATGIDYISTLISYVIPLSGVCVFILLAFATYKLTMSKGDPDKLREAKDQITNAIIGFIFILLSSSILLLLANVLGINLNI